LRFWNASEACCNFDNNSVDDVAYLQSLISEIQKSYPIDPKRVYLIGHSNGDSWLYDLHARVLISWQQQLVLAEPIFLKKQNVPRTKS